MNRVTIKPLTKPIDCAINVPGSKSYSLRALLISALCAEPFNIHNLLESSDINAMQDCLEGLKNNKPRLNAMESGVTARFITALACISSETQIIDGAPGLKKRPIKDLVDALEALGASIEYLGRKGFLPIEVKSSDLSGHEVHLKGNVSSQYLSALLLIAPNLKNGLVIEVDGEQISKPYIDMTIDIMNYFGVAVDNKNYQKYRVKPQNYIAHDYTVENDFSSAGYFFSIGALTKSNIEVRNLNPDSKQADIKLLSILEKMGAKVTKTSDSISVKGQSLKPIEVNMSDCPDQAMTVAVLAAFVNGTTKITGVKSLRVKETERVVALQNELAKMGITTEASEDLLTIYGGSPKPANIDTYGDHRLAMSFAVAATKLPGVRIMQPQVVDKTFPGFWDELQKITPVEITAFDYSNIVLSGMRGTGKSTVGRLLAKKLNMQFMDVDKYIESENNLNIKETVQKHGWEYFRKLENQAIKTLSKRTNTIISTGAGAILSDDNLKLLRSNNLVFMLKAEPKTLAQRISRYNKLPALTKHKSVYDELEEVWRDRKNRYYTSCDFIIETEHLSPAQVALEIIGKIR